MAITRCASRRAGIARKCPHASMAEPRIRSLALQELRRTRTIRSRRRSHSSGSTTRNEGEPAGVKPRGRNRDAMRVLRALLVLAVLVGCVSEGGTRSGIYELHAANEYDRAVRVTVGLDGINRYTFTIQPGDGEICDTGVPLDGAEHTFYFRADYPASGPRRRAVPSRARWPWHGSTRGASRSTQGAPFATAHLPKSSATVWLHTR